MGLEGVDSSSNERFLEKAENSLADLFAEARAKDELHFAFSLASEFRPYQETSAFDAGQAFRDYLEFLNEDTDRNRPIRARIALTFYCHIAEASGFWDVPKNMLGIVDGKKYNLMPFAELVKNFGSKENAVAPNANKVMRSLATYADHLGFEQLSQVFSEAFDADLRNAVAHADYSLSDKGVSMLGRYGAAKTISWEAFSSMLEKVVRFYWILLDLIHESMRSYNPPRVISGRLAVDDPEGNWELRYEDDGSFVITGGVGYVPKET